MSEPQFPSPGIYFNVPESKYHSVGDPVVSKSLLWDFYRSPFKWKYGPSKKATAAMDWGSLVDTLLTDFENRHKYFVVSKYERFQSNEAKDWKAAQEAKGLTVVKPEEWEAAANAVASIENSTFAPEILKHAQFQTTIVRPCVEPETGMDCNVKCRIDIVPDANGPYGDWIFDLKTTGNLAKLESAVSDFGYHAQGALYLDMFNASTVQAHNRTRFGLIFVESEEPYEVAVVEIDPDDLQAGREWFAKALALWCRCNRDKNFPSRYEDEIRVIKRPAWAKE